MTDSTSSRRLSLHGRSSRPRVAAGRASGLTLTALLAAGFLVVGSVALAPLAAASVGATAASALQVPSLDRVDSLATRGDVSGARESLTAWWDARFEDAPSRDRQRALWLRGKLTVDPGMARRDYLRLVLEYPGGPHSADAVLRLGQAEHGAGRIAEAAGYYEQLLRDYPDDPHRLEARRWLDENREAVARARPTAAPDRNEPASATTGRARSDDPSPVGRGDPSDESPAPAPEDPEPTRAGPDARPVSIQLGAFSSEERAREFIGRARERGIGALRMVRVGESRLIRVRAGRFASRDEAAASRARAEAAGFDSVVVTDADAERPVP